MLEEIADLKKLLELKERRARRFEEILAGEKAFLPPSIHTIAAKDFPRGKAGGHRQKYRRRAGVDASPSRNAKAHAEDAEYSKFKKPIDHRGLIHELLPQLPPEFTSHEFRDAGIEQYPGREEEFTMRKIKKRLNQACGYENALITQLEKGAGRRPAKYQNISQPNFLKTQPAVATAPG